MYNNSENNKHFYPCQDREMIPNYIILLTSYQPNDLSHIKLAEELLDSEMWDLIKSMYNHNKYRAYSEINLFLISKILKIVFMIKK